MSNLDDARREREHRDRAASRDAIRIGSLFAGIGGLELGLGWALEEAGIPHRVAWQVERGAFPRAVLARHWPEADRSIEDVCNAGAANLAPVDLICGGFPCQDLSYAGDGAGIVEGTRSGLWFQFARVVRELRPRLVVVENVGALLARGLGIVLGDLAEAGYDAEWRCVRASDVGAPHQRERVFVVAHADPMRQPQPEGREPHERGRACNCCGSMGNADRIGLGRRSWPLGTGVAREASAAGPDISSGCAEPGVGRSTHGLPRWLDRWPSGPGEAQQEWEAPRTAKGVTSRAAQLKAYGNAVSPPVAREVGRWLIGMGLLRG